MSNKQKIKKFFIIGDSFCDSGLLVTSSQDIFQKLNPIILEKYALPHVKSFIIKKPYHHLSLSTGQLFTEILTQSLKLENIPAWDYHHYQIDSAQTGNNYALIGARIEKAHFKSGLGLVIFDNFTLADQINALTKQHRISEDDYFLINIGANDLIFNHHDKDIIKKLATNFQLQIKKLIAQNARKIILMEIINLGTIPYFQSSPSKVQLLTNLCQAFNQTIRNIINNLQLQNHHLNFIIYPLFEKLPLMSEQFIKENHQRKIAGASKLNLLSMLQNGIIESSLKDDVTLANISNYFYIDDVHLNAWVHQKIADDLLLLIHNQFDNF